MKKYDVTIYGNAYVVVVEDGNGNKFCVKQKRARKTNVLCSVVASYIAKSCDIPVNEVRIIPTDLAFPGKTFEEEVATLHTFIPGKNRRHAFSQKLSLKQYIKKVTEKRQGLTRRVIHDMSLHHDLIRIVALDTFVSNSDRASSNIFFHKETNRYYGIDLELAFKLPSRRDLGRVACYQIEWFIKNNINFSSAELRGLKKYNKILKKLLKKNPPQKLHVLLDQVAELSGLLVNADWELLRDIERIKEKMTLQYENIQKLVRLIDHFIEQCKSRGGIIEQE